MYRWGASYFKELNLWSELYQEYYQIIQKSARTSTKHLIKRNIELKEISKYFTNLLVLNLTFPYK